VAKKWIQKASLKEGALTEQAKRAGFRSWQTFCNQPDLSPLAKKRCALARTLTKMKRGKK
jgi:hypothetical protein